MSSVNTFYAFLAQKLDAGGSETEVFVDRLTTVTGETIATSDFSEFGRGIITVNPDGTVDNPPEFISFTGISSGNVSFTGCSRGLSAKSNTVLADNKRYHPSGTPVVISFGVHNFQDLIDYLEVQTQALAVGAAQIITGLAGEALSDSNLVYLKESDGRWWKASASASSTCENVQLGVAQGSSAGAGSACVVLRGGRATNFIGLTANDMYYVSDTAGGISTTPGTISKVVGISKSTTELYFDTCFGELPKAEGSMFLGAVTGMIVMYGGTNAPTGFLLCDGSAVSRTTYSALYAVCGTSFGSGNGSTTFNIPDLRSSFPLGKGQRVRTMTFDGASAVDPATDQITVTSNDWLHTGQAVALTGATLPTGLSATTYYVIRVSATIIKLATSVADANAGTAVDITADGSGTCTITQTLTSRSLGDTGGEETHALNDSELPSHSHTYTRISGSASNPGAPSTGSTQINDQNTGTTGNDAPANNMPPYTVINYIIKY